MMNDKRSMRLKAMEGMMKEKPSMDMRKPMEQPEEGMISMAVTPEEKEMILAAREENSGMESMEEEFA